MTKSTKYENVWTDGDPLWTLSDSLQFTHQNHASAMALRPGPRRVSRTRRTPAFAGRTALRAAPATLHRGWDRKETTAPCMAVGSENDSDDHARTEKESSTNPPSAV